MQDVTTIQLIWLAIVQGVTEFLPVSSSAHLLLFSRLFGFEDQGLAIDIAVHGGSLLAVLIYFRARIAELIFGFFDFCMLRQSDKAKRFVFILIASLPLIPVGFLLSGSGLGFAEGALRSPLLVAFMTIVFAMALWHGEKFGQAYFHFWDLHWRTALFIGVMQCFALVPGVSRSGVVITACLWAGYRRQESLEIAMLLSVPAILAAVSLRGYELVISGDILLLQTALIAGGLSFVSAYIVIYLLMRYINRISFMPFVVYRLILGLFLFYIFR